MAGRPERESVVHIGFASLPGSRESPNEDWAGACPTVGVVLDGVTSPTSLDTGCIHDVPWYVTRLGAHLLHLAATQPDVTLSACLGAAISAVASMHGDTCDLSHPGTPSAAVGMARADDRSWEYLVLSDVTLVLASRNEVEVVTDHRVDAFARAEIAELRRARQGTIDHARLFRNVVQEKRKARNQPDGYWLASGNPAAAQHAVTGSLPASVALSASLLSDGAASVVDVYRSRTWPEVVHLLEAKGPRAVLDVVRSLESADPRATRWPRPKPSDDATVMFLASPLSASPVGSEHRSIGSTGA